MMIKVVNLTQKRLCTAGSDMNISCSTLVLDMPNASVAKMTRVNIANVFVKANDGWMSKNVEVS